MTTKAYKKIPSLNELIEHRLNRRDTLKGIAKSAAAPALGSLLACDSDVSGSAIKKVTDPLGFREISHFYDDTHHVAEGYEANVLIGWGDTVVGDPAPFVPADLTAESQARRFGYNNDFVCYLPLPWGSNNSDHGLLCVNHEFANPHLMFPGFSSQFHAAEMATQERVDIEQQAVGLSVIEIRKDDERWHVVANSPFARRISATTKTELTGPVAGHHRVRTAADPTGTSPLGTLGNCAGGLTPWGTVLTAEEVFTDFFWGNPDAASIPPEELRSLMIFGTAGRVLSDTYGDLSFTFKRPLYGWYHHDERFDIAHEPRESNRFGYLVEIDPYDPASVPKKRTALGRYKHEGASIIAKDGMPAVVYSGDDDMNNCVFKFISRMPYRANDRNLNLDILEDGDLYAAQFNADGTGRWIKIVLGELGITKDITDLSDQAEALIEVRRIARLAGATPMDRPEDIETDPVTGRLYLALTRNDNRTPEQVEPANPRAHNRSGHIIEILPPGADGDRDHWSDDFTWDIFLLAGNPTHPDRNNRGAYNKMISPSGWFANPDNLAFDPFGRLWIATDGFPSARGPKGDAAPVHDGVWATEITGPNRALTRHFFGCPRGAELCGPFFTPDAKTLFVAVQHPAVEPQSTYDQPSTRWPDFSEKLPPRPAVVAITKRDRGIIGS